MKYANEWRRVRTLIVEKHPFKGERITLLTPSSIKILLSLLRTQLQKTMIMTTNIEPEPEEEYLWEINPLIMSVDTLDFNNTANVEGE